MEAVVGVEVQLTNIPYIQTVPHTIEMWRKTIHLRHFSSPFFHKYGKLVQIGIIINKVSRFRA